LSQRDIDSIKKIINSLTFRRVAYFFEDDMLPIYLFKSEEFMEEQLGYRFDSEGNSLISNVPGEWHEEWFVIGYHEEFDDPIFVSLHDKNLPVYIAEHGLGIWEPICISLSLDDFIKKCKIIK